jgi:hypothetical protein
MRAELEAFYTEATESEGTTGIEKLSNAAAQ